MGKCTRVHNGLSNSNGGRHIRKEVAKLAGVSEATVSRVLNGVGPIREETRIRVLKAAEQLDYVPSSLAQSFARRRSGNLGVIVPIVPKVQVFSTYYFSEILSGIGETAKRYGYDLLLMFRAPEEPRDYTMMFRSQKVDACVILGADDRPEERAAIRELEQNGNPFCLVNQRFDGISYNTIDAEHEEGSYAAVSHLLERGCRRIAFLNGPESYSNSTDRLRGYRQALAKEGIPFDAGRLFAGNYSRKSGYEASRAVAEAITAGEIDGIFAANDRMAIGLLQGLRERGIEVGKDVALIGYDDSDGARLTEPQLSTVSVPFFNMGSLAAAKLLDGLRDSEGGEIAFHDKVPVRLVVRGSTERYQG
jgi:LacI family transcriptional regulator